MVKVNYILKDGSKKWTYYMEDLRSAVECIKGDMEGYHEISMTIIFDEENEKILELKNEPSVLIGG